MQITEESMQVLEARIPILAQEGVAVENGI